MSTSYVVALVVLVVAIGLARVVLPILPWRRVSVRLHRVDVVLAVLGMLGLAFHCGAMFYRSTILSLPGTETAVAQINALGALSIVAFATPAALLIAGLRRINSPALILIILALAAVGATMYDDGPLALHLTAIFASITLLALCTATLIGQPGTGRRPQSTPQPDVARLDRPQRNP